MKEIEAIVEDLSVDTKRSECWWILTEDEKEGLNVERWSWRLNVSGYQFDINELNVEYWILNAKFEC